MHEWSSEQYLKFKNQRTQPAIDLAGRISGLKPRRVLDIGCGPGNSTAVLRGVFPDAEIIGIDSSEDMIEKARGTYPDMRFEVRDITETAEEMGKFDVIFSNACLQWVPDHETLIPKLMSMLSDGGVLAVQMPMNAQEPVFGIVDTSVREPEWGIDIAAAAKNGTLEPEEYYDILSSCSSGFDIWETVYSHPMPSVRAMVEWVKGTRLRPYLEQLDEDTAARLERSIEKKAAEVYKKRADGNYIMRFRRFFFTAAK